uniref:G_PROTEIN_RECEP_F1_2 domain-containing protein n=1 Tax=Panagrellus redivivus TaxID=6233 RepID=A0A7E4ZVZ1_PANRE
MERFISNNEEYNKLYNCTALTPEEWNAFATPNLAIGLLYGIPSIIYLLLYIPFLIVMSRRDFMKQSCYKLMFLLGVFDVFGVIFCGIIAGYMTITGNVFCSSRDLNYLIGTFSTALWACTCSTCVILALNRVMDITMPYRSKQFFDGGRTYFWYVPPMLWGGYFLIFSYPHMYTSQYYAFFFDPYYGVDSPLIDHRDSSRPHYVHSVNNIVTLLFLQCLMLCAIIITTTSIYVTMQWVNVSTYIIILGQVTWQAGHGTWLTFKLFTFT